MLYEMQITLLTYLKEASDHKYSFKKLFRALSVCLCTLIQAVGSICPRRTRVSFFKFYLLQPCAMNLLECNLLFGDFNCVCVCVCARLCVCLKFVSEFTAYNFTLFLFRNRCRGFFVFLFLSACILNRHIL